MTYSSYWDDPLHDERQEMLAAEAEQSMFNRSEELAAAKYGRHPDDIPTPSELAEDY